MHVGRQKLAIFAEYLASVHAGLYGFSTVRLATVIQTDRPTTASV